VGGSIRTLTDHRSAKVTEWQNRRRRFADNDAELSVSAAQGAVEPNAVARREPSRRTIAPGNVRATGV